MNIYDEYISKYFKSPFHTGFTEINGHILTNSYRNIKEKVDNFNVRDQDVWIVTFPKAGK